MTTNTYSTNANKYMNQPLFYNFYIFKYTEVKNMNLMGSYDNVYFVNIYLF